MDQNCIFIFLNFSALKFNYIFYKYDIIYNIFKFAKENTCFTS